MPQRIRSAESVVVGDTVYIGGVVVNKHFDLVGLNHDHNDESTVMKLDLRQNIWTTLPKFSVTKFAMTSLGIQLVLVGGFDTVTVTGQITVFASNKWIHPYLPMNIARSDSTATSFNNHIIVAGGCDNQYRCLSSVEVLDVVSMTWYHAEPLPSIQSGMNSTLIGNTLYLMGGTKTVYKVNLSELIANAVSLKQATSNFWQMLEESLLENSTSVSIKGSLFAVGGHEDCSFKSSPSIYLYQPDSKRWVEEGKLSTARYHCACSVLPSGEVIVAGGISELNVFLTSVDFLHLFN